MIQELIIALIFAGATGYLIYTFKNHFSLKGSNCPKGCGCAGIDFKKLEQEINKAKR